LLSLLLSSLQLFHDSIRISHKLDAEELGLRNGSRPMWWWIAEQNGRYDGAYVKNCDDDQVNP